MSTTLAVVFPLGRYHATPWGRSVNEGAVEWPPSPWRVLRSLYATWKARAPHLAEEVVLELLDALAMPPLYVVPPHSLAHTRHYLPDITHMKGRPKWSKTTDYSSDATDKAVDAFVAVERNAELLIHWPGKMSQPQQAALAELAELIPYLGRAESVCEARLLEGETPAAGSSFGPLEDESATGTSDALRLLVPDRPLDVVALTARTSDVREKLRMMDPPGASWVAYQRPQPTVPSAPAPRRTSRRVYAVRWRISTPARPARKAAVAMADTLRHACMSRFGRRFDDEVSAVLAGKDADGQPLTDHRHAHYLAFSADDDQRLDTLVLWAPVGLGRRELEVLGRLHHLRGFAHVSDFRPCRLGLEAYGLVDEVAPELVGPAKVWESHTPFAPPRHAKRRTPWIEHVTDQVSEELERRGKPPPRAVEVLPGDWASYRTHRHTKNERLINARRATGVRITFAGPVTGPIAIGALSHFGLGLLLPTP